MSRLSIVSSKVLICVQISYSKAFHVLCYFVHVVIDILLYPGCFIPNLNPASHTNQNHFLLQARKLPEYGRKEYPSLLVHLTGRSSGQKKRENFLAFVLVSGSDWSFSSKFFHSELSYTKRQPSNPFVTTNSSPSCSLNLRGQSASPSHRLYDCIHP